MNISLRDNPRYNLWLVLGLLTGLYLVINLAQPLFPSAFVKTYVVQPLLWLLIAWVIYTLPRYRTAARRSMKRPLITLALTIGFFQVLLYAIGGLFSGFGESPYSFSPLGIVTNLFFVGSMLIGMELSRAWLVKRLARHHTLLAVALVTVIFTVLSLPLTQFARLSLSTESVAFLNSTFFPSLAANLLASLLALLAGPLASLAYLGVLQAFWWFLPVIPDLTWAITGLIGTVVPILGLLLVQKFYLPLTQRGRVRRVKEGSLAGWVIITGISVAIIWFSIGLFPLHPAAVYSGSMRPAMDVGDVVIIAKVTPDTIKPGDVVQFREGNYTVIHRVIEVVEIEGSKFFITKGDANNKPDTNPVIPGNVVGKAVFTIPKVGWVAIVVKGFFTG